MSVFSSCLEIRLLTATAQDLWRSLVQVVFPRKQTLNRDEHAGGLLGRALSINTGGMEGKEAGLGQARNWVVLWS